MAAEYVVRMGRRIAQARDEQGLSQNDLARMLPGKVGAQMVSKWERGLHEPRADTLEALARVLQKPVAYFMAEEPANGTPDLMGALNGAENTELVEEIKLLVERVATLSQAVADFGELLEARLPAAAPRRRRSAGS